MSKLDQYLSNLIECLSSIYKNKKHLFPGTILQVEDLKDNYHVYRSIRRTSTSLALECEVKGTDIDIVNRWTEVERAKGRRPNGLMKHHYTDVALLLRPFLRYTLAH